MTVRKGIFLHGKHRKKPDFGTKCPEVWGACQRRNTPPLLGPPQSRNLESLDWETLFRLIDKIEIGEQTIVDGQKEREIKIYYKFVGYIG